MGVCGCVCRRQSRGLFQSRSSSSPAQTPRQSETPPCSDPSPPGPLHKQVVLTSCRYGKMTSQCVCVALSIKQDLLFLESTIILCLVKRNTTYLLPVYKKTKVTICSNLAPFINSFLRFFFFILSIFNIEKNTDGNTKVIYTHGHFGSKVLLKDLVIKEWRLMY